MIQENKAPLKELKRKKAAARQEPSRNAVKTTGGKMFDGTENEDDQGAPGPGTISTKSASSSSQGKDTGVSKGMQDENEDASGDSSSESEMNMARSSERRGKKKKLSAGSFDPAVGVLILAGCSEFEALICTQDGCPDSATRWALSKIIWQRVLKANNADYKWTPDIGKLVRVSDLG